MEITEIAIRHTEMLVEIKERKNEDFALPISLNDSFSQNIIIRIKYDFLYAEFK